MSDREQDRIQQRFWCLRLARDVAWFAMFALLFVPFLVLLQLYQRLSE